VNSVTEPTTVYTAPVTGIATPDMDVSFTIFPNPSADLIALQISGMTDRDIPVEVYNLQGKLITTGVIRQGTTIWYLDTKTMYDGTYIVKVGAEGITKRVVLARN
jgi:hypothetical protein